MRHFIAMLILLAWISPAPAASFSCAAASTPVEQLICSDGALSRLDEALATRFRNSLESAQEPGAVRAEQRAWLTGTRDACSDAPCLSAAYQARIAQLGGGSVAQPTSHNTAAPSGCATLDRAVKTALDTGSPAASLSRFGNRFISAWRPSDFEAFIATLDACKTDAVNAPTLNAFPEESAALLDTLRHRSTSVGRELPSPASAPVANEPSNQADSQESMPARIVSAQPAPPAPLPRSIPSVPSINPALTSSTAAQPLQTTRQNGAVAATVAIANHPPAPAAYRANGVVSSQQDDSFALTVMGIVGV